MRCYVSSLELLSTLSKIGQREIKDIPVFYINRFDKGDFLTTHSDRGAGSNSMGVVISLTKEWNPNHGGLTFMLNQERQSISNVVVPKLGRALVFDIAEKHSPHFVSMVTASSDFRRLAIVARYK